MTYLRLPFELDLAPEIQELEKKKLLTLVNLGNSAAKSFVITKILEHRDFTNIFWASTDERADQIASSAEIFFPGTVHQVSEEIAIEQFYDLRNIVQDGKKNLFLFENLEKALEQPFPTEEQIQEHSLLLKQGQDVKVYELFEQLERLGYGPAADIILQKGEFVRRGEHLFVFPINSQVCHRCSLDGDTLESIETFPQGEDAEAKDLKPRFLKKLLLAPKTFIHKSGTLLNLLHGCDESLFISDDLDEDLCPTGDFYKIKFTTFPGEKENFFHLNFFSVLPFYTVQDFIIEVKERFHRSFSVVVATKKREEVLNLFRDNEIMFTENEDERAPSTVHLKTLKPTDYIPHSFQNNTREIVFLTDREIFQFHRNSRQRKAVAGVNLDLMTSLKRGNYVVHVDHGLAQFDGIVRRDLGESLGTREYLKLCYAENDKLFVPVESAEKVTKFIGDDAPKLTRLGSADWSQAQVKLKQEAERVAKELLKLYANREIAKAPSCDKDDEMMNAFCESFPYDLTPGQATSWMEVQADLERSKPMDRLLCGDVGFGKTEIAMRAVFKAFRAGMQSAILAPITILAEQHYQNFLERIEGQSYGLRVALLSRFQTAADQRKIIDDIKHGLVDIVIGTHRLLSGDIKFKNLGLLVIDEEQRFGVQQKEKLKELRANVHLLTMTATPIPRTLNMSLNKLKDISTITTPPTGRLPVVTEVRKYNLNLIRESILKEKARGGQVYFLHNRVQTIESQVEQLRALIPEAKFIVAHGQLTPQELEERIKKFKNQEADVLVASTIIENGIDLANANTLLVNNAERFGLSQLYQLRGRVGRSRTQAFAYFLYHGQKLDVEAKKRLRSIVEASELGSGFQIAMRDLEIRGAGEILGVSQSGAMKSVGVSHFVRMLHKTIEEMKSGEVSRDIEEEENITVEVPLSAYIPAGFIPEADEKIQVYKELASAETEQDLQDLQHELKEDYGQLPAEVNNLCRVIGLKLKLREANLSAVKIHKSSHKTYEIVLRMGQHFQPDQVFDLIKKAKFKWTITAQAIKTSLETLPITWYEDLVKEVELLKAPPKKSKK